MAWEDFADILPLDEFAEEFDCEVSCVSFGSQHNEWVSITNRQPLVSRESIQASALVQLQCESCNIIEDILESTFAKDELARDEPGFRFCAQAPLRNEEGRLIGSLVLLDREANKACDMRSFSSWSRRIECMLIISGVASSSSFNRLKPRGFVCEDTSPAFVDMQPSTRCFTSTSVASCEATVPMCQPLFPTSTSITSCDSRPFPQPPCLTSASTILPIVSRSGTIAADLCSPHGCGLPPCASRQGSLNSERWCPTATPSRMGTSDLVPDFFLKQGLTPQQSFFFESILASETSYKHRGLPSTDEDPCDR